MLDTYDQVTYGLESAHVQVNFGKEGVAIDGRVQGQVAPTVASSSREGMLAKKGKIHTAWKER
jgi:hypothetical protein